MPPTRISQDERQWNGHRTVAAAPQTTPAAQKKAEPTGLPTSERYHVEKAHERHNRDASRLNKRKQQDAEAAVNRYGSCCVQRVDRNSDHVHHFGSFSLWPLLTTSATLTGA